MRAPYDLSARRTHRPDAGRTPDEEPSTSDGLAANAGITGAALDATLDAAGLALAPVPLGIVRTAGQMHRTDSWAFRDAGVHAVHFSTGRGNDYHSPRDMLDKLSLPQALQIARSLRGLVARTVVTN